ncbi:MAG TPA: sigma-54 dependent transcriptional regulator [Vicinamibacterales bacterium]|nr:sigma-54 dependent transcriptional regulator [Vicinamibacterales bacterium]
MADILVVDDDQSIATAFKHFLTFEGHSCRIASNAHEATRLIDESRPDVVMMDIRMPGVDGLTALQQFRSQFPGLCVVMMTAYGTSQTSIDAIRAGAFDYLMKPLDLDDLRQVIDKALASQRPPDATHAAAEEPIALVGDVPAMVDVYKTIGRLATNNVPALIVGEPGTGKRLVVATIHDNSARRDRPLVAVDSATVTEEALTARLFETGAGTVELSHVDRLPAPLQARTAHALATERTRGSGTRVTARVLATAEHDLTEAVREGRFSRELYDELAIITLRLIPLRERRDDIPLLVRHFIHLFSGELGRTIRGVDQDVMQLLKEHPWPGNVGELERVIKRASILSRSDVLTVEDIGISLSNSRLAAAPAGLDSTLARTVRTALRERLEQQDRIGSAYHDILDVVETALVGEALTITKGNQVKAADILGVNRATLRKKMPSDS